MTGHTDDRERVWTDTQDWLDELDHPDPGFDPIAAPAENADDDDDHELDGAAHSPASLEQVAIGEGETASATTETDSRVDQLDDEPINLDDPEPENDALGVASDSAATDTATPQRPSTATDVVAVTPPPGDAAHSEDSTKAPRYNKGVARGFAVATAAATLLVSAALLAMRGGTTIAADHTSGPTTKVSVLPAPPATAAPGDANADAPLPFTASATGCLPGSSAAQSVAGHDPTQAWVCVTGGNIGQYLTLNLGGSMVVTGCAIKPGWVGTDASGADQWQQHRVVTRVQWIFNDIKKDGKPTVISQDTNSVHGDAVQPMPDREQGVLASQVVVLIQGSGRAPADTAPTTSAAGGPPGIFDQVLGPPAGNAPSNTTAPLPGLPDDPSRTDPADNTFAVSSITIFGHPFH